MSGMLVIDSRSLRPALVVTAATPRVGDRLGKGVAKLQTFETFDGVVYRMMPEPDAEPFDFYSMSGSSIEAGCEVDLVNMNGVSVAVGVWLKPRTH